MISKIKKPISILLSLLMVLSVFVVVPVTASAAATYTKDSAGIDDGITLVNPGDTIYTSDTSGSLLFYSDITCDYSNDGTNVGVIPRGNLWSDVDSFSINDNYMYICSSYGEPSTFIPDDGKVLKVSYRSDIDLWIIAAVDPSAIPQTPVFYTKDSEDIADGIILDSATDMICTVNTSRILVFDCDVQCDYNNEGTSVFDIRKGDTWYDTSSFLINDNNDFLFINSGTSSKLTSSSGTPFKVSYDSSENKWHIIDGSEPVPLPDDLFVKVTSEDQVTEDNIGACTFSDAKEWVYDHWDEITNGVDDGYIDFDFVYVDSNDARYTKIFGFYLNDISTKEMFKSNCNSSYNTQFDSIKEFYSSDILYLCKVRDPEPATYTVTWKNGETVLKTDTVDKDTVPAYSGNVPEKAEDENYTYTFSGWTDGTNTYGATDTLPAVTGDITYTATYTATEKPTEAPTEAPAYTVTWKNGETVLETDENVAQGTMPEYNGTTPEKAEDDDFTYTFAGWSPEIAAVTADVEYTATFDATAKYEPGYYLVGTFTTWKVDPAYKLAANPAAEGEYMITQVALTATDEYKVVYAEAGKGKTWYPDGFDNNISVETAGNYNIYFRPDGIDDEAWDYGVIFTERCVPAESTAVIDLINALPTDVTLADAEQIEAARAAYDALTDDQKSFIDEKTLSKLTDAETALTAAVDQDAADAVDDKIDSLPAEITLDDKADVEAARAAFDALTDDQKALVTPETLEKLAAAEKAIADLEAVKAVEDMIKALPAVEDITLNDKDAVQATYDAFGALTDDQVFLLDGDLFNDLLDALDKIQDLEDAKVVEDKIKALPDVILLEDKDDVEDARAAYDALEPEQKDLIDLSVVEKLEDAEEVIADREAAKAVEDQINALPEDITLADKAAVDAADEARLNLTPAQADYLTFIAIDKLFKAQDKIRDFEAAKAVDDTIDALPATVTADNKETFDAAYAAYHALTDDQKAYVDQANIDKLNAAMLAETVVETVSKLPEEITLSDWAPVVVARGFYDGLDDAAKAFVGDDTLDKLEAAEKKIADLQAAADVEEMVNELPDKDDVTVADAGEIIAARAAYNALTDDQKAMVDKDTLDKLTAAETAVINALNDAFAAAQISTQINKLPETVVAGDKDDIEAARAAYDALTDAQKALVDDETVQKLLDTEEALEQALADKATADEVSEQINALPDELTPENKDDVEAAKAAYEALTDAQKAYVDDAAMQKLTDAEEYLDSLVMLGDFDGDGEVTIIDVTLMQRYDVLLREYSEKQFKAADVDGDGDVTVIDVTFIQRYLSNIPVRYPIGEYVA